MELPSFCKNFFCKYLTDSRTNRASAQKLLRSYTRLTKYLCGAGILFASFGAFAQTYSPLALKQDVANFLASHYSQVEHERLDIKVGNLDARLRLEVCPDTIDFNLQDPSGLGGNLSVQAKCPAPGGWSIHVPAQVMVYRQIPVAARTITRGERVNASHLSNNLVNVSSIRQGYALSSEDIIGKEAKRNIAQGEAFKSSSLDSPTAIKRGESVTLQAQAGAIKVLSSGVALADGRIGQKIRVKNSSSERIVTGIVVNQGLVETL